MDYLPAAISIISEMRLYGENHAHWHPWFYFRCIAWAWDSDAAVWAGAANMGRGMVKETSQEQFNVSLF